MRSCDPPPPQNTSPVLPLARPVVLVGLMGAGKTKVGGVLARMLQIPFVDSDLEVERVAGMAVSDVFELYGESAFRDCEAKVIARLLRGQVQVIATGGGAFMNDTTRALVKNEAVSIWMRADIDTLLERTAQSGRRPLLQTDDPRAVLQRLMDLRYPVYAQADITVDSAAQTPQEMARHMMDALRDYIGEVPQP